MVEVGRFNKLKVVKEVDFGLYLDGKDDFGEILLPKRYVPNDCNVNDLLDVFIYFDSEDRIIATTKKPYATVGQVGFMKVVSVSSFGVFVDWGLEKDLLVPIREQQKPMEEKNFYFIYVYMDYRTKRIVGSEKLNKFIGTKPADFEIKDIVDLMIYDETDLGYKAIINNSYWGMLYKNEVFQTLKKGQEVKGYIKKVREDGKIDLSLYKLDYTKVHDILTKITNKLEENNGFLPINDKTQPDVIYKMFGVSKKTFKSAIGSLYKKRIIIIDDKGIKLN